MDIEASHGTMTVFVAATAIIVVALITAVFLGVLHNIDQNARTARTCIQAGNIWHQGSCLTGRQK